MLFTLHLSLIVPLWLLFAWSLMICVGKRVFPDETVVFEIRLRSMVPAWVCASVGYDELEPAWLPFIYI